MYYIYTHGYISICMFVVYTFVYVFAYIKCTVNGRMEHGFTKKKMGKFLVQESRLNQSHFPHFQLPMGNQSTAVQKQMILLLMKHQKSNRSLTLCHNANVFTYF